jgi:lysophospholipase L1-like esterase
VITDEGLEKNFPVSEDDPKETKMFTNRLFHLLIVTVFLAITACTPQVELPTATPLPTTTPLPTSTPTPWTLVVVGDSIPFNNPNDCPGCTGFVDRYAKAIIEATGHPVKVQNLSQHNNLQIDGLLQELKTDGTRRDALANADIIIVAIAHNDIAWNRNDDPCDGPTGDNPDWSKFNASCAAAAAEIFRPKYESLYTQIATMRAGKPTIFRTINRYNDWIGTKYSDGSEVPSEAAKPTREVLDAWDAMICKAATLNGFMCADIYHAFNGSDGLTPSSDLLAKDWTHPSDKGNEVIARVLVDLGFAPLVP